MSSTFWGSFFSGRCRLVFAVIPLKLLNRSRVNISYNIAYQAFKLQNKAEVLRRKSFQLLIGFFETGNKGERELAKTKVTLCFRYVDRLLNINVQFLHCRPTQKKTKTYKKICLIRNVEWKSCVRFWNVKNCTVHCLSWKFFLFKTRSGI